MELNQMSQRYDGVCALMYEPFVQFLSLRAQFAPLHRQLLIATLDVGVRRRKSNPCTFGRIDPAGFGA
jgi:hypothetical protein